jgi:hypothetical protein
MKLLPAVLVCLVAPLAQTGAPAIADDDWDWNGAIAVSPSTGAVGTISGAAGKSAESDFAPQLCSNSGAKDCKTVVTFTNTCASVVRSGDGQFFTELGDDDDTDARETRLLDKCKAGAKDCTLVTTYCAGFVRRLGPER